MFRINNVRQAARLAIRDRASTDRHCQLFITNKRSKSNQDQDHDHDHTGSRHQCRSASVALNERCDLLQRALIKLMLPDKLLRYVPCVLSVIES